MSFDFTTLLTDRTEADVYKWESLRNKGFENMSEAERATWLAGDMKGAYNKSDLNRVAAALNYLYERLYNAGYIAPSEVFRAKANWTAADIPVAADLTHYLKCVGIVREALAQYGDTPPTPTDTGALSHSEANDIEKILLDVEGLINNMLASRFYCTDLFAGEA